MIVRPVRRDGGPACVAWHCFDNADDHAGEVRWQVCDKLGHPKPTEEGKMHPMRQNWALFGPVELLAAAEVFKIKIRVHYAIEKGDKLETRSETFNAESGGTLLHMCLYQNQYDLLLEKKHWDDKLFRWWLRVVVGR